MPRVVQLLARARSRFGRPSVLFRLVLVMVVAIFLVRPLASRVGEATDMLELVDPWLTGLGFLLQIASLLCYSVMTKAALDDQRDDIGLGRLFGIQLVSRAVSSTVPGGVAAGPATGIHLMANAGISGRNASASLASASVTSAFVLNVLLWAALIVSVPVYGFNAIYAAAALVGIVVMLLVAGVFVAIVDGSELIERPVRFAARRVGSDADGVTESIRSFGGQIENLFADRSLVARLSAWATANWLLDALSLWVFLRAFGVTMSPVGLLVAFGVANVLAAIPISPGGVGIVEWAYIPILVTFGASLEQATVAVVGYRVAQFLFPIVLGGSAYVGLTLEAWGVRRKATARL